MRLRLRDRPVQCFGGHGRDSPPEEAGLGLSKRSADPPRERTAALPGGRRGTAVPGRGVSRPGHMQRTWSEPAPSRAVFACGPAFGASLSGACSPCSQACSLIDGSQEGVDFVLVLTSCPHSCPQTSLFLDDTSASRVSICDGPFTSSLSHTLKPVSSSYCICTYLLPSWLR